MLKKAREQKVCIPAFNIYNLETLEAAFAASKNKRKPLMAAFGEKYLEHASFEMIAAMANCLAKNHPVPVVLHLDHCKSMDHIQEAIAAGFTSVMYDGSELPLEENIRNTQKAVEYAHSHGVSIEAELGYMNPEDGSVEAEVEKLLYTDPEQAFQFVEQTGVDSLAVAVGNAHGVYKSTPHLSLQRLQEIYSKVQIPLVLHGGSGIPADQIHKAVEIAVAKININTEIALCGGRSIRNMIENSGGKEIRLEKLMKQAQSDMTVTLEEILTQLS